MKRSEVQAAVTEARARLSAAGIILDPTLDVEIADFGLGRYAAEGLGLVVRVNEPEYCSKYLTLMSGQECPLHYHKMKKETFFVLQGEARLWADGQIIMLAPGESFTIPPGVQHTFSSMGGAVIEEVSTHDENSDSYFFNSAIVRDTVIEED
ncbi:MAG: D-lyxose/D-mannose family sugar isomerase [Armatimonadota bacterium]|nr:D-lyxose/D-mannose family sugar isomerase [Armatimonadota bacterium]